MDYKLSQNAGMQSVFSDGQSFPCCVLVIGQNLQGIIWYLRTQHCQCCRKIVLLWIKVDSVGLSNFNRI